MTKGYRWRVAAVVALGLFMAILDNTIVSVTLPQMQKAFHTDFETITWVASAYFLAQAAVIPIVGYLSDRIGSKLVFLTALILFTLGSALCALAPPKEALLGIPIMMAPAFGPTVGGYLSTSFSWNAIFSINVPIGIVALVLAILVLPGRQADVENMGSVVGRRRFDFLGLILSM